MERFQEENRQRRSSYTDNADTANYCKEILQSKTWADAASQKGAFENYDNAKACADQNKGYKVFDWNGKQVYPAAAFQPYQVRVEITDLNIRTGPSTDYAKVQYIPVGTYTIVEEANGKGATKWGRLKSGAGWISLDYVKRV